jgi:mannose/fructose/N-acetylgalactosamine-specific phosphotransferase system component IIC
MMVAELLPLAPFIVLGALSGLDVVAFPQAMLSRPIVAATAAGALAGNPLGGLTIGVALEFFALEAMPFGSSRYPEWGSAAVIGGVLFGRVEDGTAGAMTVAVLIALIAAGIGGTSMHLLRRLNAAVARRQQARIARGSGSAVTVVQLTGLTIDLIRAGLVTALILAIAIPLYDRALASFVLTPVISRAVVVGTASAVGLAAIWKVTQSTAGARWYLVSGLLVGFGIAWRVA